MIYGIIIIRCMKLVEVSVSKMRGVDDFSRLKTPKEKVRRASGFKEVGNGGMQGLDFVSQCSH